MILKNFRTGEIINPTFETTDNSPLFKKGGKLKDRRKRFININTY